jgi:flavodoxin
MKILVVYDSFFGNTATVANLIADAIGSEDEVKALRVVDIRPEHVEDLELLVVGSPTRSWRPSASVMIFVQDLKRDKLENMYVAAFDTRIDLNTIKSRFTRFLVGRGGFAAKKIIRKMERKGGRPIAKPMGFLVDGTEGPLHEGEKVHAIRWGKEIRAAFDAKR